MLCGAMQPSFGNARMKRLFSLLVVHSGDADLGPAKRAVVNHGWQVAYLAMQRHLFFDIALRQKRQVDALPKRWVSLPACG